MSFVQSNAGGKNKLCNQYDAGAAYVWILLGIQFFGSFGFLSNRFASNIVAYAPSSEATLPTISATAKSTFSGNVMSVENPSNIVILSSKPNFFTVSLAAAAASFDASIAYTLPAPKKLVETCDVSSQSMCISILETYII